MNSPARSMTVAGLFRRSDLEAVRLTWLDIKEHLLTCRYIVKNLLFYNEISVASFRTNCHVTQVTRRLHTIIAEGLPMQNIQPFKERDFCSIKDAVDYSTLSRQEIYRMLWSGKISANKVGRRQLISVPSLIAFLNTGKRMPSNASHGTEA